MNTPFIHSEPIEGGFGLGRKVKLDGTVLPNAIRFAINLQCGPNINPRDDVALHFCPHFERNEVVRNTIIHSNWGPEELTGHFPFTRGRSFSVEITCEEDGFQISVDGIQYTKFSHRIPYSRVTHITLDGDITLRQILYGNSQPVYGFNLGGNSGPPYPNNLYPQPPPYPTPSSVNQHPFSPYPSGGHTQNYSPQYQNCHSQPYPPQHDSFPNQYNTNYYPSQPGQPCVSPQYAKTPKGGILEKGMALAGTALAGGGLVGSVLHGKKALKGHKKAQKKALKYGLPIAGVGLGAYALKKGFRRGSSSSSSSSD